MNLDASLRRLARAPESDIDPAVMALYLARDEYPHLDVEGYVNELDGMAREARRYLGSSLESQVSGLCRYLFHEMGFHGNRAEYYDPRNSYLNDVLDRQAGIPITLSVIAMAVGRRLGMRVDGVGLPGHFVAVASDEDRQVFFDPFHDGRRLSPDDCSELIKQSAGLDIEATPELLRPASTGAVVTRMLTNLKGCYLRASQFKRATRVIRRLRQIAPDDWTQARDLGACYLNAGAPGKAIDPLRLYLRKKPQAADAEVVRKLLRRAKSEISRWN
jgi:regulator of sirC expression with transglutaminase-like and TPR domain